MRAKRPTVVLAVLAVLIPALWAVAPAGSEQEAFAPFSASIKLDINSKELESEIYSYISRELRSLGDVKIVSDQEGPHWTIQIVAIQEHSQTGRVVGVAISSVVLHHLWSQAMIAYSLSKTKEHLDESMYKLLQHSMLVGCTVSNHMLQSGNREDLQEFCKKIVVDLDATCLKGERELHQRTVDHFKEVGKQE